MRHAQKFLPIKRSDSVDDLHVLIKSEDFTRYRGSLLSPFHCERSNTMEINRESLEGDRS